MMSKKKFFGIFFIIATLSLLSSAIPLIPEAYSGVAYINGEYAAQGTKISASSASGDKWESNAASNLGEWSLDITLDDPDTSVDEGAAEGEKITWYINDKKASVEGVSEDYANSGESNTNVVLYLDKKPEIQNKSTPESTSTSIKSEAQSTSTSIRQLMQKVETTTLRPAITTVPGPFSNLLSLGKETTTLKASAGEGVSVSCSDGIKNGDEEGVDCGGPCSPCKKNDRRMLYLVVGLVLLMFLLLFGILLVVLAYTVIRKKKKKQRHGRL